MRYCWPCISLNLRKDGDFLLRKHLTKSSFFSWSGDLPGDKDSSNSTFQCLQQYPSPPPHLFQISHPQPSKGWFYMKLLLFHVFWLLTSPGMFFLPPFHQPTLWSTFMVHLKPHVFHEFSLEYSNTAVPNQCCEILLMVGSCLQWASGFYISHWMFPDQRNVTAFWVFLPHPELDDLKCWSWFLHVFGHSAVHIL